MPAFAASQCLSVDFRWGVLQTRIELEFGNGKVGGQTMGSAGTSVTGEGRSRGDWLTAERVGGARGDVLELKE